MKQNNVKPAVLFVCVENSCRSQMAEGLAKHFGQDVLVAFSAGSHPSGIVNPHAVAVMEEIRIDISRNQSKGFDQWAHVDFDLAITLGCQDKCPFVPADQHIEWAIDDPKGKDIIFFRRVRDQIRDHVADLIKKLREENSNGIRRQEE